MADKRLREFNDSDLDYLHWLKNHPNGYVLNAERSISQNYLILHKAGCPSISEYKGDAEPGGFTERQYIKICSDDIDTIKQWVREKGFSSNSISQICYCWKDDWW